MKQFIGRMQHWPERHLAAAGIRWPLKPKFAGHRVLFVYKDDYADHMLYGLAAALRLKYRGVHMLRQSPEERPKNHSGADTSRVLFTVNRFRPSLVWTYNNILLPEEILWIRKQGITVMSCINGVASFSNGCCRDQAEEIESLKLLDLYLTPHGPHIIRLREMKINAYLYRWGFHPAIFCPLGNVMKRWDVLFTGDLTTHLNLARREIIETIAPRFRVAVASYKDPGIKGVEHIGFSDSSPQLNRWQNETRIVLGSDKIGNFGRLNEVPGQTIFYDDKFFFRPRAHMAAASGACYLVENHPELWGTFDRGEVETYSSLEELPAKISYLLESEILRKHIGWLGHAHMRRHYTWEDRMEEIEWLLTHLHNDGRWIY